MKLCINLIFHIEKDSLNSWVINEQVSSHIASLSMSNYAMWFECINCVDCTYAGSLFTVIVALTSCNQVVFFDCDDAFAHCKLRNDAGLPAPVWWSIACWCTEQKSVVPKARWFDEFIKCRSHCDNHTFSAFWLWSSVVSVLISVTTDMSPTGDLIVTFIFHGEVITWACSGAFTCCAKAALLWLQLTLLG